MGLLTSSVCCTSFLYTRVVIELKSRVGGRRMDVSFVLSRVGQSLDFLLILITGSKVFIPYEPIQNNSKLSTGGFSPLLGVGGHGILHWNKPLSE